MGYILLGIGAWALVCMASCWLFSRNARRNGSDEDTYGEPDPTQGRGSDVFGRRG